MAAELAVAETVVEAEAPQAPAPRTTPAVVTCEFVAQRHWGVFELIDPDSAYFWTREWREGEREADEDIKAGRMVTFESTEEAMEYLRNLANEDDA